MRKTSWHKVHVKYKVHASIKSMLSIKSMPEKGAAVNAPLLTDCPVNIERKVVGAVKPGKHDLFVATVEIEYFDEKISGRKWKHKTGRYSAFVTMRK